jgi:hypothetical protein
MVAVVLEIMSKEVWLLINLLILKEMKLSLKFIKVELKVKMREKIYIKKIHTK